MTATKETTTKIELFLFLKSFLINVEILYVFSALRLLLVERVGGCGVLGSLVDYGRWRF